jgi:NitT/TauT family transport system substrate-binding protein
MTASFSRTTRREILAALGATALAGSLARPGSAQTLATIRQGYQTNMWGMPTYYLMRSGLLEKRGLKFEEFAVPSGNLTMQQQVARQVDLGTYAGPSLIIGHSRGGLVGVAMIEYTGKTAQVIAHKDSGITKIADLKGKKVANQTGSSIGNIFMDQVAPSGGLKKGDFQEVRMDVNNKIAALTSKTVDVMVNTEPYSSIAVDQGIGMKLLDYSNFDRLPVYMAATPEFVEKHPDTIVAYLRAWLDAARDFREQPDKVAEVIYQFYTGKGYSMSLPTFKKALANVEVEPGFPSDLTPYMKKHADILLQEKKISALPDWNKILRPDFMEKARKMA